MRKISSILAAILLLPVLAGAQDKPAAVNTATFNFTVSGMNGKPRQGEMILVKSHKTKQVIQGNTGPDGKLSLKVLIQDTYTISYRLIADTIKYRDVEVLASDRGMEYDITLKHDPPRSITLKNVFFDTGLSTLKKESFPALDGLVDAMTALKKMCIEIGGHTDNVGTPESNQKLSAERAGAVRAYLVRHGVEPGRVVAKGYGDTRPVALNDTPEGRQKNRRTEVKILSE